MAWRFACGLSAGCLLVSTAAGGTPQVSAGLTIGGTVEDAVGPPNSTAGAFHLGGRADALFFRNRGADMALGPYLDAATAGLRSLDLGGGVSWLVPVRDDLPLVLSEGVFARDGAGRSWNPGMASGVFFGSRSFNFHSWYGMAVGLFAQTRWIPTTPATLDVVIGVELDAELLALPLLLGWGAVAPR